ncbi:hypothetical protein BC938DRAFT_470724 [Jimgerdemannia flammicorona]|uniref:Uncharacterized protein n=1 Tax=Jimgerdemannia flammicorona TaxID=994334 RepID=A0A433Q9K8_9FUNG|nr:hypothetical protein BC938DRAFT_470724 [Jimgerdemannia flammicorona]
MSKKSYQSLQSSLPKAVRAPFSDYNSSISDILKQVIAPLTNISGSSEIPCSARDVFTPDNNPSDIGLSEACYNFLALWPCIRASVSGL